MVRGDRTRASSNQFTRITICILTMVSQLQYRGIKNLSFASKKNILWLKQKK